MGGGQVILQRRLGKARMHLHQPGGDALPGWPANFKQRRARRLFQKEPVAILRLIYHSAITAGSIC